MIELEKTNNTKVLRSTKDYRLFKRLAGNRTVDNTRVNRIIDSIKNVGYITSPIIVNEYMEVIDGQGRLEALKKLDLPVDYIVHKGIGIKECISMNIHQTNWKIYDYISSYAEQGNDGYIKLKMLLDEFGYSFQVVVASFSGKVGGGSGLSSENTKVRMGTFEMTEESYEESRKKLEFLKKIEQQIDYKKISGSPSSLQIGVIFCYDMEDVDNDKLFNKIATYSNLLPPYDTIDSCMGSIEWLYNRNTKRDYVYIQTNFRKIMREHQSRGYKAYNSKYGYGKEYWDEKKKGIEIEDEEEDLS